LDHGLAANGRLDGDLFLCLGGSELGLFDRKRDLSAGDPRVRDSGVLCDRNQLGVRDVAFPTLNSVGFWLTATGALLVNISLVVGEFARTGWLPYPPVRELTYSLAAVRQKLHLARCSNLSSHLSNPQ
jgi:hypothetical protein